MRDPVGKMQSSSDMSKTSGQTMVEGPRKYLDRKHLLIWGSFLVAVVLVWGMLYTKIWNVDIYTEPGVVVQVNTPATGLALDPQTSTVKVGDEFSANIVLDTGRNSIDGVDIYALHYDPSLLEVIDDLPKVSGTQITPGTILPLNAANIVDKASGTIKFSQLADGGTYYSGKGVLATIHFKALAQGEAYLNFDFEPGKTIDSNAAYRGKDKLSRVVDGIYTIQAK